MLKRFFVFFLLFPVICLNSAFAEGKRAKIKNVCLTGLFETSNKDPYVNSDYMLPVDRMTHRVEFLYDTTIYTIPFVATLIKTTLEKDGKNYCDEVKIEYYSVANSEFFHNFAIIKLKGYDEDGNVMPIEKIIDYRKADNISSGWMLKNETFPADEITFNSKDYGLDKGVPDRAWFIVHYSYPASEQ